MMATEMSRPTSGLAKRIYVRAGFELVAEERVGSRFGAPQVSHTWRLRP
jgi:hypothetical protein